MNLSALVSEYEQKSQRIGVLFAKNDAFTAEDAVEVKKLNTEVEDLLVRIKAVQETEQLRQAHERREKELATPQRPEMGAVGKAQVLGLKPAGETVVKTDEGGIEMLYQDGECLMTEAQAKAICEPEYKRAFRSYLRKGLQGITGAEYRALQEGVDTSGGFLVPEEILRQIIMKKPTPTRVASMTRQLNTGRDNLVIPRVNYTANPSDDSTSSLFTTGIRTTWTGEVPASSTAMRVTEPIFGQTRVAIYTAMMSMPLTNDMIEDSLFPLVGWSSDRFTETIELLRDQMVINGTGIGQPMGILANPGGTEQPATVAIGNPLTAAGLIATAFAIPEQYEDNLRWIFNKTSTAKTIQSLPDSNNRYLWGSGLQDSGLVPGDWQNRRLLGYPVSYSGFMPNQGANNYPIIFGDLTGYFLVNRIGFSIQVLRELYAETNQVLLLGRIRFGGEVAEAWKMRICQNA